MRSLQSVSRPNTCRERLLGLPAGASVVFLRRLRFVENEPVALHLSYLPGRYAGVLNADLSGSLIQLMDAVGAHVVDSLDSVEAVIGQGEDARLLRVAPGTSLVRIEGVAFSSSREPLKYNEALYRETGSASPSIRPVRRLFGWS